MLIEPIWYGLVASLYYKKTVLVLSVSKGGIKLKLHAAISKFDFLSLCVEESPTFKWKILKVFFQALFFVTQYFKSVTVLVLGQRQTLRFV